MSAKVSRNDPCPCGSGKKHKACCEKSDGGSGRGKFLAVLVLGIVVVGLLVTIETFRKNEAGNEPYTYDAKNDRYWDPSPGHNHWHDGRPPGQPGQAPVIDPSTAARTDALPGIPATAPADGSPPAWEYDAENDKHWNPATAAWEQGMPPLEAFTSPPD